MPSGVTHSKIALATAAIIAGGGAYIGQVETALYVAGGVVIGDLLFSPDLDSSFSDALRRWNKVRLGFLWRFWMELKHRSPHSHLPVWSDVLRNLYIAFMLGLTAAVLISLFRLDLLAGPLTVFGWINRATTLNPHLCLAFFAGQCINTTLHTAADIITSEAKKVIDRKPARKRKATAGKRELRKAA